ncbi:MAG: SGNH/GDSL hydrolase family protein, partial [Solirubrobacterales bacterium]|nr:SGNH/GDSL hydrolase family protein [Solirubrobacterales bacterium]
RVLLVMACAVSLLMAMSGAALAKKHAPKPKEPTITTRTPITKGSTYLALGDSFTFGYEEAQVVPAPNYQDASSFLGYPELLGSELHLKVVNAACPGETSASLIDNTAQSNSCENLPPSKNPGGYRTMFPLHVNYSGSQLAFAVSYLKKHHDVRLVSLMIGGNDGLLCQETTADHCASLGEQAAVLATVAKNVKTILSAIRGRAHYAGQLAIVNYYSPVPADNATIPLLNQAIDTTAAPFHVEVADGLGTFTAAAAHSGGDVCKAGLVTQLVGASTPCGIHPSYAGQSLLAQSLEKVIRLG